MNTPWAVLPWALVWFFMLWRLKRQFPAQNVVAIQILSALSGFLAVSLCRMLHLFSLEPLAMDLDLEIRNLNTHTVTWALAWLVLFPSSREASRWVIRRIWGSGPFGHWALLGAACLATLYWALRLAQHPEVPISGQFWLLGIPAMAVLSLIIHLGLFPWFLDKRKSVQPIDPWLAGIWIILGFGLWI